jgi:hypothetical protein
MQDLQEFVDHYVAELSGPNAFTAWHSLIEAGPSALPLVVEAFQVAADPQVKVSLVKLVSEYRTEYAVPFLSSCLVDRRTDIWRAALDGLVILGGASAMEALREARAAVPPNQRHWIDDAMQQIIDEV